MAEGVNVRVITREDIAERNKFFIISVLIIIVGLLLYLAYSYIRTWGFNQNSTIALMISVFLILIVFIFGRKKIHRKSLFWSVFIGLLLVVILFFQFYPSISNNIKSSVENSKNIQSYNSFLEMAKSKGYPKQNTLSSSEQSELCTLRCKSDSLNLNSYSLNSDVIRCSCSNIDPMLLGANGQQQGVRTADYSINVKTLEEIK